MTIVELYTKDECHLCEQVRAVLEIVHAKHPFELKEIKIREGDDEFEKFKDRIPVVFINKKFAFQYRVIEGDFLNRLVVAERNNK